MKKLKQHTWRSSNALGISINKGFSCQKKKQLKDCGKDCQSFAFQSIENITKRYSFTFKHKFSAGHLTADMLKICRHHPQSTLPLPLPFH